MCFWLAGKNVEVTVKTPVPGTDGHLEHGLLVQAEQLCGSHGRLCAVCASWENAAKNARATRKFAARRKRSRNARIISPQGPMSWAWLMG